MFNHYELYSIWKALRKSTDRALEMKTLRLIEENEEKEGIDKNLKYKDLEEIIHVPDFSSLFR